MTRVPSVGKKYYDNLILSLESNPIVRIYCKKMDLPGKYWKALFVIS